MTTTPNLPGNLTTEAILATHAEVKARKAAESYARQEAILRDEIAELNRILGLADADHSHKVTFGYIGNLSGSRDDRRWMIFLPHPGRVGTYDDQVGGFETGSLEGIVAARRALKAVTQGARLARSI